MAIGSSSERSTDRRRQALPAPHTAHFVDTRLDGPMAVHEPHPGRQCRSVSFDDGKRRVIATDLDPEVDPLKLKPIVGRAPTPRPSRTDCAVSATPPDEHGESSRPHSAASQTSLSSHEPAPPQHKDELALNPELLMMRLTLECAGEADKERVADESVLRRERGEGLTEDARAAAKLLADDLTSEGGGSCLTE
ncbi:uncharacterized protein LOC142560765 [Dermacentor variabilis]|uniref:uncharacterized protein LOC142560765 n=1 Tax=Dermacentor variabilis TaxID=34621 RepID=UPI003F5C9F90